jgi:hypothetical protein
MLITNSYTAFPARCIESSGASDDKADSAEHISHQSNQCNLWLKFAHQFSGAPVCAQGYFNSYQRVFLPSIPCYSGGEIHFKEFSTM